MSFFLLYLACVLLTGGMLGFCTYYEMKHATLESEKTLTLSNLLIGLTVTLCPVINILAFLFGAWYFIEQVAPNIVVFRKS
jgi:hypothetical protein